MPEKTSLTTPSIKIDLSDDSAWKDFVHKPLGEEIWGDEDEGKHVPHDTSEKNWYIFLEDFEGQVLLPLRKMPQEMTEAPKESDMTVSDNGRALHYAHSNEATIGSFLSSTVATSKDYVDLGSPVVYNDSPSLIRPGDPGDCSSLVAHASSLTGLTAYISSSGSVTSVESESTSGKKSAMSPIMHASIISGNRMRRATRVSWRRGMKKVINKSGHPESTTTATSCTKKITRFRNIFEPIKDSGAREDIDDIEEW